MLDTTPRTLPNTAKPGGLAANFSAPPSCGRVPCGLAARLLLALLTVGCVGCSSTRTSLAADDPTGTASTSSEVRQASAVDRLMGPVGRRLRGAEWEQQKQDAADTGATESIPGLNDYLAAEAIYNRGDYPAAEKAFQSLVRARRWEGRSWAERTVDQFRGTKRDAFDPYYAEYGDPVEEDALFMVGECRFLQKRFSWAQDSYGELIERYPATRHLDVVTRRLFTIAQTWMGFPEVSKTGEVNLASAEAVANDPIQASNDFDRPGFFNFTNRTRPVFDTAGRALQALESIWLHDPNGPLADDALMLTANYHLRTNDYVEAARVYQLLREQYPDSPHFKDAFLLDSFVRQASYDGPGYDTQPLEVARQLKETARQLFPELTTEQRERLDAELARIEEAEVADVWHLVEFYERKNNPSGVALHCNMIINRFPSSEYAGRARQKLEKLADNYRGGQTPWWMGGELGETSTSPAPATRMARGDGPQDSMSTSGRPDAPGPAGRSTSAADGERSAAGDANKPQRSRPSLFGQLLRTVEEDPELRPVEPESAGRATTEEPAGRAEF